MARPSNKLTPEDISEIRINPPYVMNTSQVAALLGKSAQTIREWNSIHSDFPGRRGSLGGDIFVIKDELMEWMDKMHTLSKHS